MLGPYAPQRQPPSSSGRSADWYADAIERAIWVTFRPEGITLVHGLSTKRGRGRREREEEVIAPLGGVQPEGEQVGRARARKPEFEPLGVGAWVPLGDAQRLHRRVYEPAAIDHRAALCRLAAGELDGGHHTLVFLQQRTPAHQLHGIGKAVTGGKPFERD